MKLTDAKLRSLSTAGRHFDGGGLYLQAEANGSRYWRLKYRFGGKEKLLALGVYPEVSLKMARERRTTPAACWPVGKTRPRCERRRRCELNTKPRPPSKLSRASGWGIRRPAGRLTPSKPFAGVWRPRCSPKSAPSPWRTFAPAT